MGVFSKIKGIDMFSGIGGISLALSKWVRPICYIEIEKYAQAVLRSRMREGFLPQAPIWNDIETFKGKPFKGVVDIIYGGFPCQDISIAGAGKGLDGERSGLFFEIVRLAEEIKPPFIFLENVPAITGRGLSTIGKELAACGYDCRWDIVSAQEVGAPHKRERWFLLAYSSSVGSRRDCISDTDLQRCNNHESSQTRTDESSEVRTDGFEETESGGVCSIISDTDSQSLQGQQQSIGGKTTYIGEQSWWEVEPDVGRVVDELPYRVDRIKSLGNAVVPTQVEEAFRLLMGLSV